MRCLPVPASFALLVALATSACWLATVGAAATSNTVVGATVPSATAVSSAACAPLQANVTDFGSVLPGSALRTTVDCEITFSSSNDTAMLRLGQQDAIGQAMYLDTPGLDPTFSSDGIAHTILGSYQSLGGGVMLADGSVVGVGYDRGVATQDDPLVVKYASSGAPAGAFGGGDGILQVDIGVLREDLPGFSDVLAQADGKLVIAGQYAQSATNGDALVARLDPTSGAIDGTFGGGDGYATFPVSATRDDRLTALTLLADGSILVVGETYTTATDSEMLLAKLTPAGILDTTFGGGDGIATASLFTGQDSASAVQVASDGGIWVAGSSNPGAWGTSVARFTAAGVLDTGFSGDGMLFLDVGGSHDTGSDAVLQPDGKLLISVNYNTWAVLRMNPNGTLDGTWGGGDGIADTAIAPSAIKLRPDGQVLMSGDAGASSEWAISRLTSAGVTDTTFGTSGIWQSSFGGINNTLSDIEIGSDGRAFVFGTTLNWDGGNLYEASVGRIGGPPVSDYLAGATDWDQGTDMFGVCLREQLVATADWTADASCAQSDGAQWRGVPALTSNPLAKVAHTTVAGNAGTTRLRFGFRTAASQRPGAYRAPIAFEVLAPNA